MKAITTVTEVERCSNLVKDMMWLSGASDTDFSPDWIREHGWKAVPVESMARIPVPDIPRIVRAFKSGGFSRCIAVYSELGFKKKLPVLIPMMPPGDISTCYALDITQEDFRKINQQLGLFSFVLTNENRDWAISCAPTYNVFGAKPELLESVLGKSISKARKDFQEFALLLAHGRSDEPLLRIARYYADL